jgi:hypothetical protein
VAGSSGRGDIWAGTSYYEAQVLQSPEEQPEHELPVPAIVCEIPPSVVLKQAKVDILRRAGL